MKTSIELKQFHFQWIFSDSLNILPDVIVSVLSVDGVWWVRRRWRWHWWQGKKAPRNCRKAKCLCRNAGRTDTLWKRRLSFSVHPRFRWEKKQETIGKRRKARFSYRKKRSEAVDELNKAYSNDFNNKFNRTSGVSQNNNKKHFSWLLPVYLSYHFTYCLLLLHQRLL